MTKTQTTAVIGVDVGGTTTKAGLFTQDGELLLRLELPTDPTAGTKGIIAIVESMTEQAGELEAKVKAVGVGVAGFVEFATGTVTFSPNLTYDDPNIHDALRSRVNLPVFADNDANVAVWGERRFGVAQGLDHVALLTLGTGIGSGVVVDGRMLRGFKGAAAEAGHMVIDPSGPPCTCGLRGCLEQFASGTAIQRMAREAVKGDAESSIISFAGSVEDITAEHVAKAAREYDETARNVLRRAGKALGVGLSNVVNLFDPETIVMGGGVVQAGEAFLGAARDQLAAMTASQRRRPMRLDVTSLGSDAGIIGAAALAWDEVTGTAT